VRPPLLSICIVDTALVGGLVGYLRGREGRPPLNGEGGPAPCADAHAYHAATDSATMLHCHVVPVGEHLARESNTNQ
jgi:hypothetical protein